MTFWMEILFTFWLSAIGGQGTAPLTAAGPEVRPLGGITARAGWATTTTSAESTRATATEDAGTATTPDPEDRDGEIGPGMDPNG